VFERDFVGCVIILAVRVSCCSGFQTASKLRSAILNIYEFFFSWKICLLGNWCIQPLSWFFSSSLPEISRWFSAILPDRIQ
jgi:hypothetical protein